VIDNKQLKELSEHYKDIGQLFGGQMTESINRIKELETMKKMHNRLNHSKNN
jgi:hypothetical protein